MDAGDVESVPTTKKLDLINHPYSKDPKYKECILQISNKYDKYRECLRDGNCLYMAYAIALADLAKEKKDAVIRLIIEGMEEKNKGFIEFGIEELGYLEFYETYIEALVDIVNGKIEIEDVPINIWYSAVVYFRLIVSTEIRQHPDEYTPFIEYMDVGSYCQKNVDPLYKEAGYVEICALGKALPICIDIVTLQENTFNSSIYGESLYSVSILYTHNHFEPIYKIAF